MTRHGDRYDGDEAWLQDLRAWRAPGVSAGVEERLRREFRGRRRRASLQLWLGRAAVLLLLPGVVLLTKFGRNGDEGRLVRDERIVAVTVTTDSVQTELDLSGFKPVRYSRVQRIDQSVVETDLDGFVPVRRAKVTRWKGGR